MFERGRKKSGTDASGNADPVPPVRSEAVPDREIVNAVGADMVVQNLHEPTLDPEEDLQILQQVLYSYRQAAGSNPEGGENGAIVDRLRGKNRMGVRFLPESSEWVNDKGELIDRWGTPYHFHSISPTEMEIVSAGPDGELWTDDDIALQ